MSSSIPSPSVQSAYAYNNVRALLDRFLVMNQEQLLQRILLIDNRQDERALIIQALTRDLPGIQVKEILNSDGLSQAIATLDFDLAIVHDPLPWTTGLNLLRRLRAQSNCPIIMFTDSGNLDVAVAAMKAGLDDYVGLLSIVRLFP